MLKHTHTKKKKNYRAQTLQNLELTKLLQNFSKTSTPLSLHVNVDLVENLVIYDELCNQMHFKFRSNLNLPGDLNEKYTVNLNTIMTFKFN